MALTTPTTASNDWVPWGKVGDTQPDLNFRVWAAYIDGDGVPRTALAMFDGDVWSTLRNVRTEIKPYAWANLGLPAAP